MSLLLFALEAVAQDAPVATTDESGARRRFEEMALVRDGDVDWRVLDGRGIQLAPDQFAALVADDPMLRRLRRERVVTRDGMLARGVFAAGLVLGSAIPLLVVGDPSVHPLHSSDFRSVELRNGVAFSACFLLAGTGSIVALDVRGVHRRLASRQRDVSAYYDVSAVDRALTDYNAALAQELGVGP